ncbi:type IV secretory system conjugative DNA transfer family protein [Belnapia rosea]|uniref:Type IV secretory pathway, VirD4 component, TraG/TraD family ATPase n=1 Tax=Belnapia rosea TaxID=938405 RepID=A0A1G7BSH3_9PROT|nr:type IV secretory system conjugative DNA transfer family protein [Belnapia rosea]SDE30058.1 Type IV secretory pathway, VirD4 component, TraG/TraD family ATPase [Belnapia rosea]
MARAKKVSLAGRHLALGRVGRRTVRLDECLSVLAFAPPGQGKTSAVVVPSILDAPTASQVIIDLKPELYDLTAADRARHGPVFRLAWGEEDRPGRTPGASWNPLSPESLPPRHEAHARDTYLQIMVEAILPDPPHGDPTWAQLGRTAIKSFLVHYIDAVEAGNRDGIPEDYADEGPSMPGYVSWLGRMMALAATESLEAAKKPGAGEVDCMRDAFVALAATGREANQAWRSGEQMEGERPPYDETALDEIAILGATNERTRSSIMAGVANALSPFRTLAAKDRMRVSSFSFGDLRGLRDPVNGEWRPVTIYLVIKQEEIAAFAAITTLFCELLANFLIANGPDATARGGRVMGDRDVFFCLDEFPQFPRMKELMNLPAVGRSKRVFALYVAQDEAQLRQKYSDQDVEVLYTNTAAKVILGQNNDKVAKRLADMIGKYTYRSKSESQNDGDKPLGLRRQGRNWSWQGRHLVSPQELMSLSEDVQIVLVQDFANRPIRAKRPFWFNDPDYKRRVTKGSSPCPPLPALGILAGIEAEQAQGLTSHLVPLPGPDLGLEAEAEAQAEAEAEAEQTEPLAEPQAAQEAQV